jgi:hypothetical protein
VSSSVKPALRDSPLSAYWPSPKSIVTINRPSSFPLGMQWSVADDDSNGHSLKSAEVTRPPVWSGSLVA